MHGESHCTFKLNYNLTSDQQLRTFVLDRRISSSSWSNRETGGEDIEADNYDLIEPKGVSPSQIREARRQFTKESGLEHLQLSIKVYAESS